MDTPTLIGTGFVTLAVVVWIVCVIAAYQNASRRGRRPVVWTLLAVVFGPFALFALMVMKPLHPQGNEHGHDKKHESHDPRADLYEVPKKH